VVADEVEGTIGYFKIFKMFLNEFGQLLASWKKFEFFLFFI
jgi:hypothetical protein